MVSVGLVLGLSLLWWIRRDDPEALGRARVLAEKASPYDAPNLTSDELEQFERDVSGLRKGGVKKLSEALEPPPDSMRMPPTWLLGYSSEDGGQAWEAPMEILVSRMIELDPEETFREAFWRIKWHDYFSHCYILLHAKRSPDFVWEEILRIYDESWKHHDPSDMKGNFNWVDTIFESLETLEGKPSRAFLLGDEYRGKPYSDWLVQEALLGMFRSAEERGELIEFLEWKIGEGRELSDRLTRHSFGVEQVYLYDVPPLALALIAKEHPKKAIRWAGNNTLKLNFDWRAAIVAGWTEYYPADGESVVNFETKREDSLNWLLRTVAAGDTGLRNAFWNWNNDQDIEALRWLREPAVGPPEEEVKAALRAEFLK